MTGTSLSTASAASNGKHPIAMIIGDRAASLAQVAFRGVTVDSVIEAALHAAVQNPAILNCTPDSIFLSLTKVARWGLTIGEGVDLVPVKKKKGNAYELQCEAWPRYQGLLALAYRAKIARSITGYVVYEGDAFDFSLGLQPHLKHVPCAESRRGAMIGSYIIIRHLYDHPTFHWMAIEDIESVRAQSKQWGPNSCKVCPDWYAIKTVIRNYLAKQPKSGTSEIAEALKASEGEFGGADGEVQSIPSGQSGEPSTGRVVESRPATQTQRSLLAQLARSQVITDAEREQVCDYLNDEDLEFYAVAVKTDELNAIIVERKKAEAENKAAASALRGEDDHDHGA